MGEAFALLTRAAEGSPDPGVRSRLRDAADVKRMIDLRFADTACPLDGEGR